jgi:hypothetical protein
MRLTRHLAPIREKKNAYRIHVGNQKEIGHQEDESLGWRIIL